MNYNQALEYLTQLTKLGWKLGLNKIRSLLKELDNPHEKFKVVHVAGTNGKGSTSSMLAAILKAAGYKTGLYTSPHLIYVGERIKINGIGINKEELVRYIERLQPLIKKYKCTFFEAITAIALVYFADQKIDIAVVEVGLGGRLDATNVVPSIISIITNINLDHMKQLGNNRRSIAKEKAGIIKPNSVCITNSKYRSANIIFEEVCQDLNVEHIQVDRLMKVSNVSYDEKFTSLDLSINTSFFPRLKLSLLGQHQIDNAALAVTAAKIINAKFLPVKADYIYQGLLEVNWPGRLHLLSNNPRIVVDVAHNPDGIISLRKSIQQTFKYDRLIVVMGVVRDKAYESMVKKIAPIVDVFIAVKANNHRSLSATVLSQTAKVYIQNVKKFNKISAGLNFAIEIASQKDLILCTGSHYSVAEIFQALNRNEI